MKTLAILLALCATALAQEPKGPEPKGEDMPAADVGRWMGFFDKLVESVVSNASACDKMATDVSYLIDKNHDVINMARTARTQHRKLPLAAQQHMLDGVKKMMPGMQNCGDNQKVQTAFAKLDVK